jgi:membrane protein
VRFFYAIIRDVLSTTLTLRAMGLVYITILSIVPLLALLFAALKGFGIHRSRIEPALQNLLTPLGDKGVELTKQLILIVDNVQGGLLAGIGLLLLIYTTVSMIKKVEDSLNFVWRVENSRGIAQRFGEYLSVILVGPLIMITALGLIATVGSNAMVERMLAIDALGASAVMLGKLMPYLLLSLGFGLAYWFIPNTRVKIGAAMGGGLIGGMLWATSGVLFATFVVSSTRNFDIYASFAVVIIALMWLYISWLILLIGAQASFYLQNPEYLRVGYRQLKVGGALRERAAVSMMLLMAKRFRSGEPALSINEFARELKIPGLLLGAVGHRLRSAGLIDFASNDRVVPQNDPGNMAVSSILEAVRNPQDGDIFNGGAWPQRVVSLFRRMETAARNELKDQSLYDMLDSEDNNTSETETAPLIAGDSHLVDQN